ncbi:MAG: 1-acylglycerol-3-phosphate O-acyltransferase [Bacteriovoracaceae bacterium]
MRPFHPDNNWLISQLLGRVGLKILGLEFQAINRDVLGQIQPAVIISNHQNNLDMFPGAMMCPRRTAILGKTSIKWIPFFGQFFWLAGNLFIDRYDPIKSKKAMSILTEKIVSTKRSVWIMPEGTRSKGKGLLPFKKGAFVTAKNAQVPIIPVVFSSYHNRFNFNNFKSGKIIAYVLDPIPTEEVQRMSLEDLALKCHKMMKMKLIEIDKQIEEGA